MRKSALSMTENRSKINSIHNLNNQSALHPRKVEGKDLLKSTVKTNFEKTILDLKNKPSNKTIEQQYINGLQQQIKFLQYQLKLLKDKQLQQRSGLNQLDNFLKDEIPINQNILAMKNKYNTTKSNLQTQHKKLGEQIEEANMVLEMQKQQIKKIHTQISTHKSQLKDRLKQHKQKCAQYEKQMMNLKIMYDQIIDDNKKKQQQMKIMNDEMLSIYRLHEKQKITEVRKQDQKQKKQTKIKDAIIDSKQQFVSTQIKIQQLQQLGDTNPLIAPVQNQIVYMKKKLMLSQKQKNTADNRVAQIDLFLQQAKKQREAERIQKQKILDQVQCFKLELNNLQKNVEDLIKKQLKYHKIYTIKKINVQTEQKDRYLMFYGDRLKKLQQQCQGLIQDKKQLGQNLQQEQALIKERKQKIKNLQKKLTDIRCNTESSRRYGELVQKQINPLKNELNRTTNRIPLVQNEIQKKLEQIEHFNKQIQLIKQLKNLNLEQIKLMRIGGSQIQQTLQNFMKKWEKIKTSSQLK